MSNFTLSLDIDSLKITAQTIDTQGNIIFDVESTKTETPCHKCGQLTNKRYGFGETIGSSVFPGESCKHLVTPQIKKQSLKI